MKRQRKMVSVNKKVSILIPSYNAEDTIEETLDSCIMQDYPNLEIIVSDNNSTDHTVDIISNYPQVRLEKGLTNVYGAKNMEKLLNYATGDYLIFMCADDYFTNSLVISDIVNLFNAYPRVGYLGRYYYQFIDGYRGAVRTHRADNAYTCADNPSGLAFRKECLPLSVIDKPFIEVASIVKQVLAKGWQYLVIAYDTVAVRIGNNNSRSSRVYKESPIKNWVELVGKDYPVNCFVSFVQVKSYGGQLKLLREVYYFIKYRPLNLLSAGFWFFFLITILTPRTILMPITRFYKHRIGRLSAKEIKRW